MCDIGLALGGIYGIREGYTRPLSVSSSRLRVNSILNSVTRRGSYFANSAGVIGEHDYFLYTFSLSNG
jgi:import inner membrane translocase subunit TIM23